MRHNRGVALLTVLFILAVMSTVAAYAVEREFLGIRRASNIYELEQARQMSLGSELWATRVLEKDAQTNKTDSAADAWAHLGSSVTVEEGKLATTVEDDQGLFNLNNLAAGRDQVWYPAFRRLLGALDIDENLADAVVDWIDQNNNVTGIGGAEDNTYLAKTPPYRAANRPFTEVSELQWVQGFNTKAIAALAPYLTALPVADVRINVNTCPALLLSVLTNPPLSSDAVKALVDGRGDKGYASVAAFLARPELAGKGATAAKMISVSSAYFTITSAAKYDRVNYVLQTLVERQAAGAGILVLARRRGVP